MLENMEDLDGPETRPVVENGKWVEEKDGEKMDVQV